MVHFSMMTENDENKVSCSLGYIVMNEEFFNDHLKEIVYSRLKDALILTQLKS